LKQFLIYIFLTASSSGYDNSATKKTGFQKTATATTTTTTATAAIATSNGQAKSVLQMSNDWRNQSYHLQEQNINSNNYSR